MNFLTHHTAKPSHYNEDAKTYDAFNEVNSKIINKTINQILKKYRVKTVLDLACGTGSQVFWLAKHKYAVVGADINSNMLKVAKSKAKKEKVELEFFKGDMRTSKIGEFDSVITIFNAVGHLTKLDFEKAIRNIYKNLKEGGYYLFDIFNLNYLTKDNNITKLTIDWQKVSRDTKSRCIQYSTIDKEGILASHTISHEQKSSGKPKISTSAQTLQVYTAKQLKDMLHRNGFKVLNQSGIDGSKFNETKTERLLMIAKKQ